MNSNGMENDGRGNTKAGRELPWRMYRHGFSYRFHHPDGRRINLGRDLNSALMKYQLIIGGRQVAQFCTDEEVAKMLKRHQKGAKDRGLSFGIDVAHIKSVLVRQHYVCAVTGLQFRDDKPLGARIRPWLPSIDRIDTRIGYEPGNVRVVCGFVNVALNAFGDDGLTQVMEPLIEAEVQRRLTALTAGACRCRQYGLTLPSVTSGLKEIQALLSEPEKPLRP